MFAVSDSCATCFSTTFALLGLKLLFGSKPVTFGSVLLLACISGAVASAWEGGTGAWVEVNVATFLNSTLKEGSVFGGAHAEGILRSIFSRMNGMNGANVNSETEQNEL